MIRVGPRNSITDVPGIRVGNAEDHGLITGTTVIVPEEAALCAVDHRGGAIGARDTIALMPGSVGGWVHAICLSGGSAFGLDASGGVMDALRQEGKGFAFGGTLVPIVPSAIIFDLMVGQPSWDTPPWWDLGKAAYLAATTDFALGNSGAGIGATAGDLKGGLGTASFRSDDYTLGALAVVNPVGSTVIPGSDTFWAWITEQDGELGGQTPPRAQPDILKAAPWVGTPNTTLVVVATDADLDRDMALRLAIMAQDGIARAINPVHSPMDGDTVFVLSTGQKDRPDPTRGLTKLGALAADATSRAIARGVYEADALAGIPSYLDRHGG
ncbi:MAG: P1 family peptidase [Pseudomonadota bacterium]